MAAGDEATTTCGFCLSDKHRELHSAPRDGVKRSRDALSLGTDAAQWVSHNCHLISLPFCPTPVMPERKLKPTGSQAKEVFNVPVLKRYGAELGVLQLG